MAPATSMELSDMLNASIVERTATNFTKFHEFFAHCAPATQEFFPELSGNCDSDSDPGAARRPVSPRRHGGHGDFTEASGFSVPLRVLRGGEKKCIAGFQPAKVVLTQKELSRLRCRRDAGATIFSHDPCLRGEKRMCESCKLQPL